MSAARSSSAGLSLVEMMVAMTLGALLLTALLKYVATAGESMRTRDAVADMQERARYALNVLATDILMAGNLGNTARGGDFAWLAGGAPAALPVALRQNSPPLGLVPAAAHACGDNYAIDVAIPIQADNNTYRLGTNRTSGCSARGGAVAGTDTLTIRRSTSSDGVPESGRVQLLADAFERTQRWLLADGALPAGLPLSERTELHDLQTHIYYVASDSDGQPGTPALRVKSLTRVSGRPSFVDTEVISGVEDLQLQFITASGSYDPGMTPPAEALLAARLWLRVRGPAAEVAFSDDRIYRYADVVRAIDGAAQHYRRLLVARTIALRNAPTE